MRYICIYIYIHIKRIYGLFLLFLLCVVECDNIYINRWLLVGVQLCKGKNVWFCVYEVILLLLLLFFVDLFDIEKNKILVHMVRSFLKMSVQLLSLSVKTLNGKNEWGQDKRDYWRWNFFLHDHYLLCWVYIKGKNGWN